MNYQLDPNAAKQADNFFSKIEQKGKYLGVITRAEQVTSSKGTQGVDFSFKSNDGATADYLTVWTLNKDGKQLSGFNCLMAIMTCLRVRELKAEDGEVEKYDRDQQKRIKVTVPLFKELMGKQIGLLIHMEEYEKTKGGTDWKPLISAPFDKDEFTASEILSKAQKPEMLSKMVTALRDRPLRRKDSNGSSASQDVPPSFFDDEAPF
jgi:hypothetical protein